MVTKDVSRRESKRRDKRLRCGKRAPLGPREASEEKAHGNPPCELEGEEPGKKKMGTGLGPGRACIIKSSRFLRETGKENMGVRMLMGKLEKKTTGKHGLPQIYQRKIRYDRKLEARSN